MHLLDTVVKRIAIGELLLALCKIYACINLTLCKSGSVRSPLLRVSLNRWA